MKRLTTTIGIILAVNFTGYSQVQFGFAAGVVNSNLYLTARGQREQLHRKTGLLVGLSAKCALLNRLNFDAALDFLQKGGWKEFRDNLGNPYKITTNIYCLELPADLVFNIPVFKGILFLGGGPSLSYSLNVPKGIDFPLAYEIYDKRLAIDGEIKAGFETKFRVWLAVNYNWGFSSVSSFKMDHTRLINRYLGIKIGYGLPSIKKHKGS